MNIALVTDGTWGDVLPFIFLAQELKNRGHEVTIYTNEYYKQYITSQNINFTAVTTLSLRNSFLSNEKLWHPTQGVKVIGKASQEILKESWSVLNKIKHPDLIVSYTFMYSAHTLADLYNIPCITLCISPIQIRSHKHLPTLFTGQNYNFLPQIGKKIFYYIGDTFFIDPYFKKAVNDLRKSLNLSPIKSFVHHSTLKYPTIGLWPEWYSKKESDQPNLHLTNFPKNVEFINEDNSEIISWIKSGTAPVIVTMGSGYRFYSQLIQELKKISSSKNRFLIIAGTETYSLSEESHICIVPTVKLSSILPLGKVFIHHGGAGTVAQAINAGIPQLVIPMSHDQPDNASLIKSNGLGDILWGVTPKAEDIIKKIDKIISNKKIKDNCKIAQEKSLKENDSFVLAVDFIEENFISDKS